MLSVRACCGGGPPAHNPQQSNEVKQIAINRRLANGGVLYTFATALIPAAAAAADLTPYERGFRMQYGLSQDGKIRGCPSDVNPNCVSSASLNDTYSPAWEATAEASAQNAMGVFEAALLSVSPDAELVDRQSTLSSEYRRYRIGNPLFDHDDVEVLISERGDGEPPLVTYRSMAGTVRYVWPITLPISDFGAQRARMKAVRDALGWRIPGCDLIECFLE